MLSEHVRPEELKAYRERMLAPDDLLAVDDHLAVCNACRTQLLPEKDLHTTFAAMSAALHPDVDLESEHLLSGQMAAYVANTLDEVDREIADAHLESCRACTDAVSKLAAARPQPAHSRTWVERANTFLESVRAAWTGPWPVLQRGFAVAVLILGAWVAWERVGLRRVEQRFTALNESAGALRRENESLRNNTGSERSREAPAVATSTASSVKQTVQDTAGVVSLGTGDAVTLMAQVTLPSGVDESVRQLLTTGVVTPMASARPKLDMLRGGATRTTPLGQAGATAQIPVPITPVQTAIRSSTPNLSWKAVSSAREYGVTVADEDGNVVWQSNTGTATSVVVPSGTLRRGRVYFWQVEALGERSALSQKAGFWLLDARNLHEVETTERTFERSALIRAGVYAAYGLYDEALSEVERLATLNPGNPQVQTMQANLRRRVGRD